MALFSQDRILVPIDFSDQSFLALKETLDFGNDATQIYAIHILRPLEATEPGVVWQSVDTETRKQAVEKNFQQEFPPGKHPGLEFIVDIGDPSSQILDYAEKLEVGLIVMPSRGRTGLSRFFMGSVAEKIVRFAHCPVLVLRH
ncbi:MAG: universal stress protein [Synechococcales cyanobacterium RM1_1_8]|nr:universal stress protein [Synechococcales cyanobacterium RM1_1_8]